MKVAIVKYNAGNIQSVMFALQRLGIQPIVTNDPELLRQADKVRKGHYRFLNSSFNLKSSFFIIALA